jgi:delta24-sterol reductase
LVGLELKIIRVKPYVRLEYLPVRGQTNYCDRIRELSGADGSKSDVDLPDFLEATVFNKEEAVITVGTFADVKTNEQRAKINHVTKWYKPWWYKHVESFLQKVRGIFEPMFQTIIWFS